MKNTVIREMTTDEIREKIEDEETLLQKLKMNNSVSQLENPVQIRLKRKDIARLKTELHARLTANAS